jgi:hypothetical protein
MAAHAVGGRSAHLRGRVIMNNHATRLGLVGVYGSSWNSSCAHKYPLCTGVAAWRALVGAASNRLIGDRDAGGGSLIPF